MKLEAHKKSSGYNASLIAPNIDEIRKTKKLIPGYLVEDYQDYCAFCAKIHWVFNEMHQAICDPLKKENIMGMTYEDAERSGILDNVENKLNHAWRCTTCKLKNKRKTFDGRKMTDEKRWTAATSTMERPKVWRDPISKVIVGSQKRLK